MARYIDADELHIKMEDLYEHHIEMKNFSADGAVADCLDLLDKQPTADVVEVKHGEWERKIKNGRPRGLKCSLCGRNIHFHENYCPECGAKMDRQ